MGAQAAKQSQTAKIAQIQRASGVDLSHLSTLAPSDQENEIKRLIDELTSKREKETDPRKKAALNRAINQLGQRLVQIQRQKQARDIKATIPDVGVKYICYREDDGRSLDSGRAADVSDFTFSCKHYGDNGELRSQLAEQSNSKLSSDVPTAEYFRREYMKGYY